MQLFIGDNALIAWFTFPEDRRFCPARAGRMPVHAVVTCIDAAACEPFGEGRVPFESLGERPEPRKLFKRQFRPELLWILSGTIIEFAILLNAFHLGARSKFRRRGICLRFTHAGLGRYSGQFNAARSGVRPFSNASIKMR